MRSGARCSRRPAGPSLRASLSRSFRGAAADRRFDQLPAVWLERHAVAATHSDETLLVELGRQCFGLVLVDAQPIGNDRDRGPAPRIVADLFVKGAAELAGTASRHAVLI